MSVLPIVAFPFSGLDRNSRSGSMPLSLVPVRSVSQYTRTNLLHRPVDFLRSRFDFVVSISRFDAQLEDQLISFIHKKRSSDAFLDRVTYHDFGKTNGIVDFLIVHTYRCTLTENREV